MQLCTCHVAGTSHLLPSERFVSARTLQARHLLDYVRDAEQYGRDEDTSAGAIAAAIAVPVVIVLCCACGWTIAICCCGWAAVSSWLCGRGGGHGSASTHPGGKRVTVYSSLHATHNAAAANPPQRQHSGYQGSPGAASQSSAPWAAHAPHAQHSAMSNASQRTGETPSWQGCGARYDHGSPTYSAGQQGLQQTNSYGSEGRPATAPPAH